jgi:hypothetical protein
MEAWRRSPRLARSNAYAWDSQRKHRARPPHVGDEYVVRHYAGLGDAVPHLDDTVRVDWSVCAAVSDHFVAKPYEPYLRACEERGALAVIHLIAGSITKRAKPVLVRTEM